LWQISETICLNQIDNLVLVIVDTGPAYFPGDDSNNNVSAETSNVARVDEAARLAGGDYLRASQEGRRQERPDTFWCWRLPVTTSAPGG
jgi:hypothetical protein